MALTTGRKIQGKDSILALFRAEGRGQTYEQWLEQSLLKLVNHVYEETLRDGRSSGDAEASLEHVFPSIYAEADPGDDEDFGPDPEDDFSITNEARLDREHEREMDGLRKDD